MSLRSKRKKRRSRRSPDRVARNDVVGVAEENSGRVDGQDSSILARTLYLPPLKPRAWTSKCGFGVSISSATAAAVMAGLAVVGVTSAGRGPSVATVGTGPNVCYEDSTLAALIGDAVDDATSTTVQTHPVELYVAPTEEAHGRPVAVSAAASLPFEETCSRAIVPEYWYTLGSGESTSDVRSKDTTSAIAVTETPEVIPRQRNDDGATPDGTATNEAEGNTAVPAASASFAQTDAHNSREGAVEDNTTPSATNTRVLAPSGIIPPGGAKIREVCSAAFPDVLAAPHALLGDGTTAAAISSFPAEEDSMALAGKAPCQDKAPLGALLACPVPGMPSSAVFVSEAGTAIESKSCPLRSIHGKGEALPATTSTSREDTGKISRFDPPPASETTLEDSTTTVDAEMTAMESPFFFRADFAEASTDSKPLGSCPLAAGAPSMAGNGGGGEAVPDEVDPYPATADASEEDSTQFTREGRGTDLALDEAFSSASATSTLEAVFTPEAGSSTQETQTPAPAPAFAAPPKREEQVLPVEVQNSETEQDDEKALVVQDGNSSEEEQGEEEKIEGKEDDGNNSVGLEILVREFNSWIASMDFPVRKVEAKLVGNGMRVGVVATEAIAEGLPYLSVPESVVLDASKAREDPELGPPLARLQAALSPMGLWDEDTDSLRVLLVAEMFVRADASPWAPYLGLLPTPSDMKSYHPLFFDDATIASFKGSDVRAPLRRRRDAEVVGFARKFAEEGSPGLEFEDVLGAGWMTLERYLWATAILESRCIWWGGRKHLVPLLDFVNNAQTRPLTPVHETLQDSEGNAVTAAPQDFDVGAQVLEDYGHPNHALLTVHGFSLVGGDDNDGDIHDCVRIDALRPLRGPAEYWEMLARMQEAFPAGRPMFCISLRRHGPYDFVSYARIMAGLSALPLQQHQQAGDPTNDDNGSGHAG
ncbi:unnamed protein product, partial [Pylaiella littoralis]